MGVDWMDEEDEPEDGDHGEYDDDMPCPYCHGTGIMRTGGIAVDCAECGGTGSE
jgi:hypothetical protein